MSDIAKAYESGEVSGWLESSRPGIARAAFSLLKEYFTPFKIVGQTQETKGQKMFLHDVTRAAMNCGVWAVPDYYKQEIGDCVSFGAKHGTTICSMVEIFKNGEAEKWRPVHPSYYYGTGRLYEGNMGGYEDGSVGSWMAAAIMKWGTLFADEPGAPKYSGQIAKQFGANRQSIDKWKASAMPFPMKSATQINSWDELVAAIVNGYPVTTASSIGYNMEPGRDGFHAQTTSWNHQMCAPPDAIVMAETPKEIQNIRVGDKVISHDGNYHTVTEVYTREYNGEMINLKARGGLTLRLTNLHPVLVSRESENNFDENTSDGGILVVTKKRVSVWVNAEDIKLGDRLLMPKPTRIKMEVPDWIRENQGREVPRLFLDEDVAWMFGLYAADGSSEKSHKTVITLNSKELDFAERCVETWKKLGVTATIKPVKGKNAIRVTVYSAIIANSMNEWFGKGQNKYLPEWLFHSDYQKDVMRGLFDGDGGFAHKSTTQRFVNTSRVLVEQMRNMLLAYNKKPSLSRFVDKKHPNFKPRYTIEWNNGVGHKKGNLWNDDGCFELEVTSKVIEQYVGTVYNLEVEDSHTYLCEGYVVHNCFIGVDDGYKNGEEPYALILNNWDDVHGHLKDFDNGSDLPYGILRVRRRDAEKHIRAGETYAYSQFQGMPEQRLDRSKFKFL